jgi:plasmid segregation protein ParM
MNKISIDIGYSFTKILYNNQLYKIPSAISFAVDSGIQFGVDNNYLFEGRKYHVGELASSDESFVTTDYSFVLKYSPLIIYHILKKLNVPTDTEIELRTGLALADWSNKEEFSKRISVIKVNNEEVRTKPILIPQGAGAVVAYVTHALESKYPSSLLCIDIGYNTINLLSYEGNEPIKQRCKSFPGHGVSSIIRPFTNFMEQTFSIPFSESEAIKIFMRGTFTYNGISRPEVTEMIAELKLNFIDKLINSILKSEKKYLGLSEIVLFSGGGAYFLKDIQLPPNVRFPESNYEFYNVMGYAL